MEPFIQLEVLDCLGFSPAKCFNATNFSSNFSVQANQASTVFTAVEIVIGSIFLLALIILAFLGNLLTCVVFCRKSHLRTPTNVSIAVLAVSDILSAVLVMPFSLASFISERWTLWNAACVANAYLILALLGVTIISMTCTAVIRYFRVMRPSLHHCLKAKRTLIAMSTLWQAYVLLIILPAFLEFPEGRYNPKRGFCRLHYKNKQNRELANIVRYIALISGVFLVLIMFTAYYKLFGFVSHHNNMVAPHLQHAQGISPHVEEAKVTKTLVIVVVGFVLCWLPTAVIEGLNVTSRIHKIKVPAFAVFLQTLFICTSSAINPLIYTFTNKRFRREYAVFWRSLLPSNRQIQSSN